jgi:Spy/CpxP family protein refolding chaperone
MKRWYAGMAVAVLFVALAVTVYAGPGGMGPGMGPGGYAYLNLSQDQMDKMWQLKNKYYNDTQATRYQMFQKQVELRKLYADPKADGAAIAAKEQEVSSLQQQLSDTMAQMRLEQRSFLTPEQIQKLKEAPYGYGRGPRGFGRM